MLFGQSPVILPGEGFHRFAFPVETTLKRLLLRAAEIRSVATMAEIPVVVEKIELAEAPIGRHRAQNLTIGAIERHCKVLRTLRRVDAARVLKAGLSYQIGKGEDFALNIVQFEHTLKLFEAHFQTLLLLGRLESGENALSNRLEDRLALAAHAVGIPHGLENVLGTVVKAQTLAATARLCCHPLEFLVGERGANEAYNPITGDVDRRRVEHVVVTTLLVKVLHQVHPESNHLAAPIRLGNFLVFAHIFSFYFNDPD